MKTHGIGSSKYEAFPWFEVYNLIEFLVGHIGSSKFLPRRDQDVLAFQVNMILQEEFSAFRFIEGYLAPISNPGPPKTPSVLEPNATP